MLKKVRDLSKSLSFRHGFLSFLSEIRKRDFYKEQRKHILLYAGIILGLAVPIMVFLFPYRHWFFIAWLTSLGTIGFYFFKKRKVRRKAFNLKDVLIFIGILLSFSSLYLSSLDSGPVNIDADELNILNAVQGGLEEDLSPFYPAYYYYYANMNFMLYAKLIDSFGDINFENMRTMVAVVGLLSIGMTYLLFRLFASRFDSIVGAVLLGISHVHIGYSRVGLLNSMVVLLTLVAALFFLHGWLRKERWSLFVGGLFAGLGWYTYAVGRLIIVVFLVFFGLYILMNRFRVDWKMLFKLGFVTFLGFLVAVSPFLAATLKISEEGDHFARFFGGDNAVTAFIKEQVILFHEGREEQKIIKDVETDLEVFQSTAREGLLIFNYHEPRYYDRYVYDFYRSPKGGLVDMLTGILLWIGLISALIIRKCRDVTLFFAGGFFFLWFVFCTMVVTPYQARTLIFFPFVVYFAYQGMVFISDKISEKLNAKSLRLMIFILLFLAVVSINLKNYSDSVAYDAKTPDDLGVIYRDFLSRFSEENSELFYIGKHYDGLPVLNDWERAYFLYGEYYDFYHLDQSLREDQKLVVIDFSRPFDLNEYNENVATLYTTKRLFSGNVREQFEARYEILAVHHLTEIEDIIAVELRR